MSGLYYTSQVTAVLIGSKSGTTRTSVTLSSSYDVTTDSVKIFETGGCSKVNFDILYTMGASETSNSIEMRVETSPDRTNWYRIPNESNSSGTSTLTAREFTFVGANAAAATISIGLDSFYKYMKVAVKETGVSSNAGTAYVEATLSGK